jgi:peptide/nickel transport system permease protein
LAEELGLNLPLGQQYLNWLRDFFTGKMGNSFYGYEVWPQIKSVLPLSLLVFLPGVALAYIIGLQLGKYTGWKSPPLLSNAATLGGMALFTSFPPWLAWLLAYFLGRRLGLFRSFFSSAGIHDLDRILWREAPFTPNTVAYRMLLVLTVSGIAIAVLNAVVQRRFRRRISIWLLIAITLGITYLVLDLMGLRLFVADLAAAAMLPLVTFTLLSFGETMLIMRTSMSDHREEEYIQVARAKGLPEHVVRDRHASRNAILPVVSRLIITLPYLFTGVVIIEDVLEWPGLGSAMFSSLYQQDMPMVMAMFIIVGALTLVARLVLEVVLAMLDPRIRFASASPERV